jgi:hypothetical protein
LKKLNWHRGESILRPQGGAHSQVPSQYHQANPSGFLLIIVELVLVGQLTYMNFLQSQKYDFWYWYTTNDKNNILEESMDKNINNINGFRRIV